MMGDHDGRSVGRATLLVRAADVILGTHTAAKGNGGISDAVGEFLGG
jgi:hypothetical protein